MSIVKSLDGLLESYYGISTRHQINKEVAEVDIAVTRIAINKPVRLGLVFVNLSGANMYVMPDNAVSTTRGIYLAPNGGSVTLRWNDDFSLVAHEWWATAAADASAILVLETVIT